MLILHRKIFDAIIMSLTASQLEDLAVMFDDVQDLYTPFMERLTELKPAVAKNVIGGSR